MKMSRRRAMQLIAATVPAVATSHTLTATQSPPPAITRFTFDGIHSELKIPIKDLGLAAPADLSAYSHLVMEMRLSSPQHFSLSAYTTHGRRGMLVGAYGQNVWLRASIPLRYFMGRDPSGKDLASAGNRRTNTCAIAVWGPYGDLHAVEALGFSMEYPLGRPTIEIRNIHFSKDDEGSEFLEPGPVLDSFGQWARGDWPRKLKSQEQLTRELAEEEKSFVSTAAFGCLPSGGYKDTQVRATGFFRVEQIDGRWWFVDPQGHFFLSTGSNATPDGSTASSGPGLDTERTNRRLDSWGMTTGGRGRPHIIPLHWPDGTNYLGIRDVYAPPFAADVDSAAAAQCAPHKDDPLVLGYTIGNEPPWGGRESEVCGLFLDGAETATKAKLKEFLAVGDTPARRREFILGCFSRYLEILCGAIRKHDPNHLILGIRFGGHPSDEVLIASGIFDVCSINVYEYEPTKQIIHAARLLARPILITEFHIGVPADGLAAGLVQAKDQTERGLAFRYYVEQAASLPWFVGAFWFRWDDQPVLGRPDGENFNCGLVDVTGRPYVELVEAAKITHKRLKDVHSGKLLPFAQHPLASDAGAPSSPWNT